MHRGWVVLESLPMRVGIYACPGPGTWFMMSAGLLCSSPLPCCRIATERVQGLIGFELMTMAGAAFSRGYELMHCCVLHAGGRNACCWFLSAADVSEAGSAQAAGRTWSHELQLVPRQPLALHLQLTRVQGFNVGCRTLCGSWVNCILLHAGGWNACRGPSVATNVSAAVSVRAAGPHS